MAGLGWRHDDPSRARSPTIAGAMTAHRARHARLWRMRRRLVARAMTNHRERHGDSWPARWPLMVRAMLTHGARDDRPRSRRSPWIAAIMSIFGARDGCASRRPNPVIAPTKCGYAAKGAPDRGPRGASRAHPTRGMPRSIPRKATRPPVATCRGRKRRAGSCLTTRGPGVTPDTLRPSTRRRSRSQGRCTPMRRSRTARAPCR